MQVPDSNSVILASNQFQCPVGMVSLMDNSSNMQQRQQHQRNNYTKPQIAAFLQKRIKKTRICAHYLNGRCSHGNECSFAHSAEELRELPNLFKTRLCNEYMQNPNGCQQGNACRYAHGMEELRATAEVYKTALCTSWSTSGSCPSEDRCRWAHGAQELRQMPHGANMGNHNRFRQNANNSNYKGGNQHYDMNRKRMSASLANSNRKERLSSAMAGEAMANQDLAFGMDPTAMAMTGGASAVAGSIDPTAFSQAYIGGVPLIQNDKFPYMHRNYGIAAGAGATAGLTYDLPQAAFCYEQASDFFHHPTAMFSPAYSTLPGFYPLIQQQTQQSTQQPPQVASQQQGMAICSDSNAKILHESDAASFSQLQYAVNLDPAAPNEIKQFPEAEGGVASPPTKSTASYET